MADLKTFHAGTYETKIGESFNPSSSSQHYHTVRYDFKPASVAEGAETFLSFGENTEVTIATLPKNTEQESTNDNMTVYKGSKKEAKEKECILLFDHDSGQFSIETLNSNVQVKKTRGDSDADLREKINKIRVKEKHIGKPLEEESSSDEGSSDSDDSSGSDDSKHDKVPSPQHEPPAMQPPPPPTQPPKARTVPQNAHGVPLGDGEQSFSVEITRDDVMDVVAYFRGQLGNYEQRCQCFIRNPFAYWHLFPLLVDVAMWIVSVSTFFCPDEADLDESAEDNLSPQEKLELADFLTMLFSEQFYLYVAFKREKIPDFDDNDREKCKQFYDHCTSIPYPMQHTVKLLYERQFFHLILTNLESPDIIKYLSFAIANSLIHILVKARPVLLTQIRKDLLYECFDNIAHCLIQCLRDTPEVVRDQSFRMISDTIVKCGQEEAEERGSLDVGGLYLAIEHLDSPYLGTRIWGMHHVNEYIRTTTEIVSPDTRTVQDNEKILNRLAEELQSCKTVAKIFGPNAHQEILKQAIHLVEFLAKRNKLSKKDIELIWLVAQKKDCSRQVFDLLITVIKFIDPLLVLYLYGFLKNMKAAEHTEMSLHLTYIVMDTVWNWSMVRFRILQHRAPGKRRTESVDSPQKTADTSNETVESTSGAASVGSTSSGGSNEVASATANILPGESVEFERPTCGSQSAKQIIIDQESDHGSSTDDEVETLSDRCFGSDAGIRVCHPSPEGPTKRPSAESIPADQSTPKKPRMMDEGAGPSSHSTNPVISVMIDGKAQAFCDFDKRLPSSPPFQRIVGPSSNGQFLNAQQINEQLFEQLRTTQRQTHHQGIELSDDSDVSSDRMTSASDQLIDDDDEFTLGMDSSSPVGLVDEEESDLSGQFSASLSREQLMAFLRPRPEIVQQHVPDQQQFWSAQHWRIAKGEVSFPVFRVDDVTKPGQTLLWDLLMKEGEDTLAKEETITAVKFLSELVQDYRLFPIAMQFFVALLDNLKQHKCTFISLLILPKILSCMLFLSRREEDTNSLKLIAELDSRYQLLDTFLADFDHICANRDNITKYTYENHLKVRFEFLDFIFDSSSSDTNLALTVGQFKSLCQCLFGDQLLARPKLCQWLLAQSESDTGHAITEDVLEYLVEYKLDEFCPETMSTVELRVLQACLERSVCTVAIEKCLSLLWQIALRNNKTDVSRAAMGSLSTYYIGFSNVEEAAKKEDDFIRLCTSNLRRAVESLDQGADEARLTEIHRALMILRTHLEDFRKRHGFILRIWELERAELRPHTERVQLDASHKSMRINVQTSGKSDKPQLFVSPTDTLGELRAEIAFWMCNSMKKQVFDVFNKETPTKMDQGTDMELEQTPPNATVKPDGSVEYTTSSPKACSSNSIDFDIINPSLLPIRLLFSGHELTNTHDGKKLIELGIHDTVTISVSVGSIKNDDFQSGLPCPEATPMFKLLHEDNWYLLMTVIDKLTKCASQVDPSDRIRCMEFAARAWELLMNLPTNPPYEQKLKDILIQPIEADPKTDSEESESRWDSVLNSNSKHSLLYALQILASLIHTEKLKFCKLGGVKHLLKIVLSKSLFPDSDDDWNQWDLDCLTFTMHILHHCLLHPDEMIKYATWQHQRRLDVNRHGKQETPVLLYDTDLLENVGKSLVKTLMDLLRELSLERPVLQLHPLTRVPCLQSSFLILTELIFSAPNDFIAAFLARSDLTNWLKTLILECTDPYLRNESMVGLFRICYGKTTSNTQPGRVLVSPLLNALLVSLKEAQLLGPYMVEEVECSSKKHGDLIYKEQRGPSAFQYFTLAHLLIENLKQTDGDVLSPVRLNELAKDLVSYLVSRPIYERKDSFYADNGLRGLLQLTRDVVKLQPEWKFGEEGKELLDNVWDFVFKLPTSADKLLPKCKSVDCKMAAFDLIVELSHGCDRNFGLVYLWLTAQHDKSANDTYPWEYWPQDEQRSSCGFVGLLNLGATCYMATALQHLFMIPRVRSAILALDATQTIRHKTELEELQKLFAYLYESERKAYDPRSFCQAYHMDGQLLNTSEQKDMTEFFTDLITKLEEMNPDMKRKLQALFCGVMSNNVVSEDCKHVSKVTEEFYTVRCQVADMKDLCASLDELTIADVLEGENMYTCSQCNKKVRAKKRACFKQLPEIMSFNTMRYSFNMLTMMKEKVNAHFSFPRRLNLRPYMEESLLPDHASHTESQDDGSYLYDLIGVTVHTGTAEGGHYYSFIKDPNEESKWYCFNDADVKQWDPANLAADCFGGELTRHQYDTSSERFLDLSFEKANSAYMVFYQRVPSDNTKSVVSKIEQIKIPSHIEESIWQDNNKFVRDLLMFNHHYSNFVWQMCAQVPNSIVKTEEKDKITMQTAQLNLRFLLDTLLHAKEKPMIHNWIELILKDLSSRPEASEWFLQSMVNDSKWPLEILLKCPMASCRQVFEKLVNHVFMSFNEKHKQLYLEPWKEGQGPEELDPGVVGQGSVITKFVGKLLSLLTNFELGVEMRQLSEYFSLLFNFAQCGPEAKRYLLLVGTIRILVNYYMMRTTQELTEPLEDLSEDDDLGLLSLVRQACLNRTLWVGPALERLTQLIIVLLRAAKPEGFIRNEDMAALLMGVKPFPFLMQQIRDASNLNLAAELISVVCNFKLNLAKPIINEIFACIVRSQKEQQASPFFTVLTNLCSDRLSAMADKPFSRIILEHIWLAADLKAVYCLNWLQRIVGSCPEIHQKLINTMDLWVEKYLFHNPSNNARCAAGDLLLSLVPSNTIRQNYLNFLSAGRHDRGTLSSPHISLPPESLSVLHQVFEYLLSLLRKPADLFAACKHSHNRLVHFLTAIRACLISNDEKQMLSQYMPAFWRIFEQFPQHEKLVPNKQALFQCWHTACIGNTKVVDESIKSTTFYNKFMNNFVAIDNTDRDLLQYNKACLAAYYGLMAAFCKRSENFCLTAMGHENMFFAVRSVWTCLELKQAGEAISHVLEICCRSQLGENTRSFKRKVWDTVADASRNSRSNYPILLQSLRFLIDSPDDKMYLLERDVLNVLSNVFATVHHMHHQATAVRTSTDDMVELLKRFYDFLQRTQQCKETDKTEAKAHQILVEWTQPSNVAKMLLELLNSYVPQDIRKESINCLRTLIQLYGGDGDGDAIIIKNIVEFVRRCHQTKHSACNLTCTVGPYFPKRGANPPERASKQLHPPEPMLDMVINPLQLETAKGVDLLYDQQLSEYFNPYHNFVDLLIRCAINLMQQHGYQDATGVVDLSAMIGVEGVPIHSTLFPKLWIDVFERMQKNMPQLNNLIEILVQSDFLVGYFGSVLTSEQSNLAQPFTFKFCQMFMLKVLTEREMLSDPRYRRTTVDNACEAINSMEKCIQSAYNKEKLARNSIHIIGCLRALTLVLSLFPKEELTEINEKFVPDLNCLLEKLNEFSTKCDKDKEMLEKLQQISITIGETVLIITQTVQVCEMADQEKPVDVESENKEKEKSV